MSSPEYSKCLLFNVLFLLIFSACVNSQQSENYKDLEIPGLSSEFIIELENKAKKLPNIYSFIIIKNNGVASENYFNGVDRNSLFHIRSITKSISALLIGKMSFDDSMFDLEEYIMGFYPNYSLNNDGSEIHEISIQHILDMKSGFSWDESVEAINWYTNTTNPLEYILSKKIDNKPGTVWNYNSGAVHLLASVFDSLANQNQAKYAEKNLFQMLDIENYSWDKDPQGIVRPDAGLALKAMDLVKIGTLFLDEGSFEEKAVIPAVWINEIKNFKIDLNSSYGLMENLHYNNLWWMANYHEVDIYFALGYGGQFLLVVPEYDLVVVTNHEYRLDGNTASQQARTFINTIFIPLLDHLTE